MSRAPKDHSPSSFSHFDRIRSCHRARIATPCRLGTLQPEELERRTFLSAATVGVAGGAVAEVVGRYVFYNNSAFDGHDGAANEADDAAVANDKAPLLPGEAAGATNYTSYSKGINGVMLDVTGLSADLGADDFEFHVGTGEDLEVWEAAPAPAAVTRRAGAGQNGADRVTVLWDDGAIRNQWLRVTVKANGDTGLAAADVFYFGNLVADTADSAAGASAAAVNLGDLRGVRNALFSASPVTGRYDVNRDGRVSVVDFTLLRRNYGASLAMFTAPEPDPGTGGDLSFHVPVRLEGQTPVTLYPIESVLPGQATRVTFGVPFPRGFVPLGELSEVRLLDAGGAERPVYVELLSPWRDLSTGTDLDSARSVMVQTDVAFPDADGDGDADPVAVSLEWGRTARSLPALAETPVRENWVRYDNAAAPATTDYKAADNVFEPPAYAVFTPQWYGDAVIKTRLLPDGTDPAFAGYDTAYKNFGTTAVNDVDPRVTAANLLHITTDSEPWLFDRATALYQLAFRTGSLLYLREAHRAAQFYANHITSSGYFDLKDGDIKYVYGEAISADYWLTGDDRMLAVHRRMIPMFDRDFDAAYSPGDFWTERHAAYKLLGYVTGYELLGDASIAQKARDTFTAYVNHQNNPPAGAANTGLLMHRSEDHIEGGSEFIASPWMTVLLVDAVERYYVHSGDDRVPQFVTRIADGINRIDESMYYTDEVDGVRRLVPFYLAGPGLDEDQHARDPWSDLEHAIDVSKVFALAYFFSRQAGTPNDEYIGRFNELSDAGQGSFQYWTRPGGPSSGLSVYRLNPPRKFNWWFRTTANRDFLVGGDAPQASDTLGPTATLVAPNHTTAGSDLYTFVMMYSDNRGIDVSTLDSNDVSVRAPDGSRQNATLVSVDSNSNGSPRTVTYGVPAPGGTWDPSDNGVYQIDILPDQVSDTSGLFLEGQFMGRFTVEIPVV